MIINSAGYFRSNCENMTGISIFVLFESFRTLAIYGHRHHNWKPLSFQVTAHRCHSERHSLETMEIHGIFVLSRDQNKIPKTAQTILDYMPLHSINSMWSDRPTLMTHTHNIQMHQAAINPFTLLNTHRAWINWFDWLLHACWMFALFVLLFLLWLWLFCGATYTVVFIWKK